MRKTAKILMLLGLAAMVAPLLAGEGRIPVYQPGILGAPGKYVLTRNINGSLEIAAGDVELDLNGFVVDNSAGPNPAIASFGGNHNLRIHNGKVIGGSENILISQAQRVVVEDVIALNAGGIGIFMDDTKDFQIRNTIVTNAGSEGMRVHGSGIPGPTVGTIEDCVVEQMDTGISVLEAAGIALRNNRIHEGGANPGILLDKASAVVVAGNTIKFAGSNGIELRDSGGGLFTDNVIDQSNLAGILVSDLSQDNLFRGNVVTNNQDHGVVMDGNRNTLQGNTLNGNTRWGLFLSPLAFDNVFRANTARGNNTVGSPPCGGKFGTNDLCDVNPPGPNDNDSQGDNWMPLSI